MATAQASITLATDANRVWQLIGGFDALPDWLPFIPESALSEGGRVRTLKSVAGDTIIERLLDFNEAGRSYSYTILKGPAPVRDYQATLRVVAEGSGSRVEWWSHLPARGQGPAETCRTPGITRPQTGPGRVGWAVHRLRQRCHPYWGVAQGIAPGS